MPPKDNSVKIKYPSGSARPSETEIVRFLVKHGVTGDDVTAVYPDVRSMCYFVKFIEGEKAKQFIEVTQNESIFEYANKVTTNVMVCDANADWKYIRIFELAPEVADEDVMNAFAAYGEVKNITWEKVKPHPGFEVYNGVRGVQLNMVNDVPDLIEIAGEKKRVVYQGMVLRCYRCKATGHKSFECPLGPNARLRSGRNLVTIETNSDTEFPRLPGVNRENSFERAEDEQTPVSVQTNQRLTDPPTLLHSSTEQTSESTTNGKVERNKSSSPPHRGRSREKKNTANSKESTSSTGTNDDNDLIKNLSTHQREKLRDRSRLNRSSSKHGSSVRSRSNSRHSDSDQQ